MKKMLGAAAAATLVLGLAVPAFAGGAHCSGGASNTTAANEEACVGKDSKNKSTAWAGAWLQRTKSGSVTVAEVASGSPAARSGLKSGDVVLAVNGYRLSDSNEREMCASKADCKIGSSVAYTVQRGNSTKTIKVKLAKMPSDAMATFASRKATFEPALAAVILPTIQ